ncbi:integrator complex subunit 5-like [Scleropages formosus]|uniref:Integrator complex subunit 5 n=1 Tax=Scleropages formosus TaxID=113540 RepID=A0A0P7UWA7_SCLFO|nr:integrator complex subunit 5 [Scleropages formosus]KPP66062.1 integrator complex subunit 5-like [Scleropages formosus]
MSAVFDGAPLSAMQSPQAPQSSLSPQELALEIKAFISGVDQAQGRKLSVRDHARCAVRLLRTVPACRGAALEHLRGVYDEYVLAFLQDLEGEGDGGGAGGSGSLSLEDVIEEIHGVLSEFIRLNPKAWAPLVSSWAVDLLGQLSSKHAGRRGAPHSSSLNELLQLWMSCTATRSLMENYSQCLAAMLAWCPDACVDALLDTSVQHSPHFDWVVAHIGSSFPGTIISRVLACGLKDFCAHGYQGAASPEMPNQQSSLMLCATEKSCVPKIGSVVGILGHLASRHADSIKKELLRMFQESLTSAQPPSGVAVRESSPQLRRATVPFLLQLAALSPTLLGAVSAELVDCLRPPVLLQLQEQFQVLPREEIDNMVSLAVHLISQNPAGGPRVLRFLVDTATPASVIMSGPASAPQEGIRESCDRLLQLLLLHLHKLVYNRPDGDDIYPPSSSSTSTFLSPPRVIPFLEELRGHVGELCAETLKLERKRHLWLHQLLCLLSVYGGPSVATEALCQLLTLARTPEELALSSQLHAPLSICLPGLLPAAVMRCVAQIHTQNLGSKELAQLLNNLASVIQNNEEENRGASGVQSSMAAQVGVAVSSHLHDFCPLLLHGNPAVSQAAARLLSCSQLSRAASPAELLVISRAAVAHFFLALRLRAGGNGGKDGGDSVSYSIQLLSRLAAFSQLTLKAVLQQLVEGALHRGNADLFGGQREDQDGDHPSPSLTPDLGTSLLNINCKFGTTVNFSGSVWSVFHAGVIGMGLKTPHIVPHSDPERVTQNLQTLLAVAVHCCSSSSGGTNSSNGTSGGNSRCLPSDEPAPISAEAAKVIAVTLVESVCPDVANGELVWPPEEHARTTVERDIHIRRCFEGNPVLFHLLRVVAAGRPALCYCSVVLRGLLATLLAHWESSREQTALDSPWHLQASCLLVSCMGEGQLLPPVLSNIHEIFPYLTPFEVRLLLLAVWEYMRGNSPMPQKFSFSAEKGLFYRDFSRDGDLSRYLAPVYSVLHKNIDQLGHLCWRFQL